MKNILFISLLLLSGVAFGASFKYGGIKHDITSVTATGVTTTLTASSTQVYAFNGSNGQIVKLPAANTLSTGYWYQLNNNSTKAIDVQDNGGASIGKLAASQSGTFYVANAGSAAGTWSLRTGLPPVATGTGVVLGSGDTFINSTSLILPGSTSGTASLKASASTTTYSMTLPSAQCTNGQVMANDGGGNLYCASAGAGTVTSVGLSDGSTSPIFTISNSPVTTSGTLTETLSNQNKNIVFAGPSSGAAAQPTFRAIVNDDIPAPTTTKLGGIRAIASGSLTLVDSIGTSGAPTNKTLAQGSNITLTDSGNVITIAASGGTAGTVASSSGATIATPSSAFGATTNQSWQSIKIGNLLYVQGNFTTGSPQASPCKINLIGNTLNQAWYAVGKKQYVGTAQYLPTSATNWNTGSINYAVFVDSADLNNVYVAGQASAVASQAFNPSNCNAIFGSTEGATFQFTVLVQ